MLHKRKLWWHYIIIVDARNKRRPRIINTTSRIYAAHMRLCDVRLWSCANSLLLTASNHQSSLQWSLVCTLPVTFQRNKCRPRIAAVQKRAAKVRISNWSASILLFSCNVRNVTYNFYITGLHDHYTLLLLCHRKFCTPEIWHPHCTPTPTYSACLLS